MPSLCGQGILLRAVVSTAVHQYDDSLLSINFAEAVNLLRYSVCAREQFQLASKTKRIV